MKRIRAACIIFMMVGCSKASEPGKSDEATKPTAKTTLAKPEKQAPTAAAFGKTIAPFGELTKVKIGMTEAEAKKAAPGFWDAKGGAKLTDSEFEGLHFGLSFVDGQLNSLRVSNLGKTDLRPMLTTAWGKGIEAKNSIDRPIVVWLDPASQWRAVVEGTPGDITFAQYLPASKLLGDDPVAIAAFPKPIVGATADELRRDYPDFFVHKTAEQIAADSKKAEEIAKWAGVKDTSALKPTTSSDSVTMKLPPTEWASMYTSILPIIMDGKVSTYFFTITDDGYPPGNETTLALMKKKWGEPKIKKTYKEKLIFHAKDPFISAERDASNKGWEIHVAKDTSSI